MSKEKTAMSIHILHMKKVKEMVISKKVDKDLKETILETIDGCIENAESFLEREKNQIRKSYNQGGKWASEVSSENYFNQDFTQSLE